MRKFLLLTVCILGQILAVQAQHKPTMISGIVQDEKGKPIDFATIILMDTKKNDLTDEQGAFRLKLGSGGTYKLVVQHVSYESKEVNVKVEDGGHVKQNIVLSAKEAILDDVVLQVKKPIEKVRESAYNVIAIDAKPLYNSSLDVSGALDRVSGVKVRRDGAEGSDYTFSMNGFSGRHIRFFMDGVPMEGFGSEFKINNLPITMVDRIEVYKGVVPVEFGSDALGGAVNIITNKSKETKIDASFTTGSFNTYKSHLNVSKVFDNGMTFQVNAFQNYSDNNYKVYVPVANLKTGVYSKEKKWVKRFNDRFQTATVVAKVGVLDKSYADRLLIGFTYGEGKKGVQTGTIMEKVFGQKKRRSVTIMPSLEYSKRNLFTEGLDVALTSNYNGGYNQNIDTSRYKYNWAGERIKTMKKGESGGGPSLVKFFDHNGSTTANVSYKVNDKHSFSLNNVIYYFNRKTEDPLAVKETESEKKSETTRRSLKNITALSYRYNILDNLNVSVFGKHYSIKHTYLSESTSVDKSGYGIAATYLWKDFQVKSSFEKTYRLPTDSELFGDGDMVWGNTDLKPEAGNNYNFNLSYSTVLDKVHAVFADAGFVYRKTEDYIRSNPYGSGSRASSVNIGGVESIGLNVEARYVYNDFLQLGGSLTTQSIRSKQKYAIGSDELNSYYNERIPNEPYFFGSLDAGFLFKDVIVKGNNLNVGYNLRYIDHYSYDFSSIGENPIWIPSQVVHDLSASYSFFNNSLHATVEANNVFDKLAYDNYSFQKPGRSFMFKIRYSY
ncbi:outer membrane receptor protein involved in Fe transport [Myroides gitamensis]|uniref:TonB-dependent receptor n=1 Tax=Myroides odoratus TaxID=256 RepID=UPI0021684069|nr:TonB-dependent receptor [Myroides odoratus]MCS4239480.1 outer membrane receptor protein involved in Fe transport [Myroides odoratus]MDH6601327.1 outer membrane receptor protein involved in Fe transport [Myroides gitamensis]